MTRILIVDDRDDNRYLLRALFGGNGFEVDEARHGAEALEHARRAPPDLVISDLQMPIVDGFMLLRQWKADPQLCSVPFVVYTATYTSAEDEQLARSLGADEFIIKPADPDDFVRHMRDVIERIRTDGTLATHASALDEQESLRAHSQILTAKLTQKVEQLDAVNRKLGESERHYRALFEAHPQPMWVYDLETLRFLAVNDAAIAHYGYSRDEFLAMTIADIRPPEDVPRLRKSVAEVRPGRVHDAGIWRHHLRDGREIKVEIRSHVMDWFGRRAEIVLVIDMTARIRAEQTLAASERRFHATFEQAAAGIAIVAADGRYLDVNQRLCEIVGYRRDELLARTFQQLTHPDDLAQDLAFVADILAGTRRSYALEKRYIHQEGHAVWINMAVALVRNQDGMPDYFVAVIEDISARRQAEEALRKLSRAVEQTSESIVITDAGGRIEYVNDSFVQTSGYARDELIGHNSRLLQSGTTPRPIYDDLWTTITAGRTWHGEFINRRKDGSEYIEAATISPLRESDGHIAHFVGVKQDVTEKRRTERELERHRQRLEDLVRERTAELDDARARAEAANEAKSVFLANMSHEIRTPMNGVLGMLEILEHGDLNEAQVEMVRTARESGRTLLGIIDDILDLSKIEAGRMQIEMQEVNLVSLAERLVDSLLPVATLRKVDVAVFVDPILPDWVLSDPLRLRQILFNLIGNAIKFSTNGTGRRGDVRLRISPVEGESAAPLVAFAITDKGLGMNAETVARLFQPFTQAEASTTRRFGGTGLGLAICRRLAVLMGGEIKVTSAPGNGSTFTLVLPMAPAPRQPQRNWPDLHGFSIEVTRDDDGDAIAAYLTAAGASVRRAAATGTTQIVIRGGVHSPATLNLTRGDGPQSPQEVPGIVRLERDALRRTALLHAVALAAGCSTEPSPAPPATIPPDTAAAVLAEPILVAEDDQVNQRVIAKQLELLGRVAEIVGDGAQALERWRQKRHALLLTDLHMPELDGYQLVQSIRRIEASEHPPRRTAILALTANALFGEADRARTAGFDGYLTKPLTLEDLRQALTQHREAPDSPVEFDASVTRPNFGEDTAAREVLSRFRQTLPAQRDTLREACATGNAEVAARTAQRLAAEARCAGALALGARCEFIEAAARGGGDLTGHAAAIVVAADAADAAIEAWLASRPAHDTDFGGQRQ